jgi:hypothetical protein
MTGSPALGAGLSDMCFFRASGQIEYLISVSIFFSRGFIIFLDFILMTFYININTLSFRVPCEKLLLPLKDTTYCQTIRKE